MKLPTSVYLRVPSSSFERKRRLHRVSQCKGTSQRKEFPIILYIIKIFNHFCTMKFLRNKILWTVIFYAWLIVIFILTSVSFSNEIAAKEETGLRWDYFEHFFFFFAIPILYFFAEGAFLSKIIKNNYIIILLGLTFSAFTEIQQIYIEGRSFNPKDLILNLSGLIIGILLGKFLFKLIRISGVQKS